MADTPVFQGHHLIEQNAFEQSQLLKSLARSGHFTLHGSDNILNLPANPALATRLGISPHSGGPLSAYSDQLKFVLDDLAETYDGRALLAKDSAPDVRAAAAERMGTRIQNLEFTLRAGILNGDLVTNTPENMTPAEANARIRTFFADLDGYQRTHAAQIAELKTLNPTELRWRGVTHSEANVTAALDAIDQSGNSTLSERWGPRIVGHRNPGGQPGRPTAAERAHRGPRAYGVQPGDATDHHAPWPGNHGSGTGRLCWARWRCGRCRRSCHRARTDYRRARTRGRGYCRTGRGLRHHRPPRGRVAQRGQQRRRKICGHHFVGRTAGGFGGGFLLGAGYGLFTGSWTGPGAGYRAAGRRGRWLRR